MKIKKRDDVVEWILMHYDVDMNQVNLLTCILNEEVEIFSILSTEDEFYQNTMSMIQL